MESTEWMLHSAEKELNSVFERTIQTFQVEKLEDLTSSSVLRYDISREMYADLLYQFVVICHRTKLVLRSAADQMEVMKSGCLGADRKYGKDSTRMSAATSNFGRGESSIKTIGKEESTQDEIEQSVLATNCTERLNFSMKDRKLTRISEVGLKSNCLETDSRLRRQSAVGQTHRGELNQQPLVETERYSTREEKIIPKTPHGDKSNPIEINMNEQKLTLRRGPFQFSNSIRWKTSLNSFKNEFRDWSKTVKLNLDETLKTRRVKQMFVSSIHSSSEEQSVQKVIIFGTEEQENDLNRPVHLNYIVDEVLQKVLNSETSHLSDIISCRRVGVSDKKRTEPRPIKVKLKLSDRLTNVVDIATEQKISAEIVAKDNCEEQYQVAKRREDVYIY